MRGWVLVKTRSIIAPVDSVTSRCPPSTRRSSPAWRLRGRSGRSERRARLRLPTSGAARTWSGLLDQSADLIVGRIALQHLREHRFGARELDELRILIEGDANGAGLLGERLEHCLTNPPDGVRDELHALVGIEFLDGLEEAFVADGNELGEVETVTLVFLDVRDDESEVALQRSASFSSLLCARARRRSLRVRVRKFLKSGVLSTWRRGTEVTFGPALRHRCIPTLK